MLSSLNGPNFKRSISESIVGLMKGTKKGSKEFIHRDELTKNPSTKRGNNKKKRCEFEQKKSGNDVIRVKVKMTKQEAERLMAKCKNGGEFEFRDLANQLVQIPPNRVTVFPVGFNGRAAVGALETILEEA